MKGISNILPLFTKTVLCVLCAIGLSLGAYFHTAAVGLDGYRLVSPYPIQANEKRWLFKEKDTHQNENLSEKNLETEKYLVGILDSLIKISDYTLERGL